MALFSFLRAFSSMQLSSLLAPLGIAADAALDLLLSFVHAVSSTITVAWEAPLLLLLAPL